MTHHAHERKRRKKTRRSAYICFESRQQLELVLASSEEAKSVDKDLLDRVYGMSTEATILVAAIGGGPVIVD